MTTAGEFCNRRVVVAKRGETLGDAARRMLDEHVGCLVVVEEDEPGQPKPVGMLTDRDIVVGVLARTDRHLDAITVGDVMTPSPVTAEEDEPFEDVFKRLRSFGIRRIPVVNQQGGLEGLMTFDDWVEFLEEQIADLASVMVFERKHEARIKGGAPAARRMPSEPAVIEATPLWKYTRGRMVVLGPQTDVYSAVRALEDNHIGSIVVHDGSGVVGIVTDRDLALRVESSGLDPLQTTLRDVMTTDVATLPPMATIDEAAHLMRDRHIRRIPIVHGSEVLGLVTLDDLLVEQAIDPLTVADIVRMQLSEPSRHKDSGQIRPSAPVHHPPTAPDS
jgi:CBS domain-containing protein